MEQKEIQQHKKFLAMAVQLAQENVGSGKGGPFGAVIVKDGQVLATGTNQVLSTQDPTMHAEVSAIRNACAKLKSFDLKDCKMPLLINAVNLGEFKIASLLIQNGADYKPYLEDIRETTAKMKVNLKNMLEQKPESRDYIYTKLEKCKEFLRFLNTLESEGSTGCER